MTYGYGDARDGWPPPSEPEPARGRRRAPDPDEPAPGEEPGWRHGDPVFQAPPTPPVYDVPRRDPARDAGREPGREPPVSGRHAAGRATPPGPREPGPAAREPGRPVGRDAGRAAPPGAIPPYGRQAPDQRPPQDSRQPADPRALTDRYVPRRGSVYGGTGRSSGYGAPPPPPAEFAPDRPAAVPQQFAPDRPYAPEWPAAPERPFPAAPERPFPAAPERPFPAAPPARRPETRPDTAADRRLPASLWKSILGGVVIVALLVIVGVGAFSLVNRGKAAAGPSTPPKHDISSQTVDPAPLTETEVFPGPTVAASQTDTGYQVAKTEASNDCKIAAVGDLATTLASDGCTQVVRATMVSTDKAFVVTAGLLNLRDQASATAAEDAVKASVTGGKGRFNGLAAGGATDVIAKVATQLGWDSRGHFLAFAVIARADGTTIAANDPTVAKIINTIIEDYLKGTVLQARIDARPPSGPAAASMKPSAKPSPSKTSSKK
jgi:hypothetical protein